MKLRSYFYILAISLIAIFGLIIYDNVDSLSWTTIALFTIIVLVLIYLIFFYQKVVRPLQNISNGMDLLREQDFSSRLRKIGQHEADKVVYIFNKMMEQLKNERLNLREQNKFLDLLIKASPMGVLVLDYDDEVSDLNPSAIKILGINNGKQIIGQNINKMMPTLRIKLSDVPLHETRMLNVNDGTVYKCTHESFIDQGFPRRFYLFESLTEEVRIAERKAYEKVIRMISHEVNNTTSGIISTLDIVEQSLAEDDENKDMKDALSICIERSYNMSKFITNFADVVKIPKAELRLTNINELIESSIRFMEVVCNNRNINLKFIPDINMSPVPIDGILFEQAIQNIIKNSAESIGNNGFIHITTDSFTNSLTITDNGKGISKEAESKLFSPFFSTKPSGQGIGLMFIQDVLNQHHCQYSLQTGDDGLTRFRVGFLG